MLAKEKEGSGGKVTELMCHMAVDPKLGGPAAFFSERIARDGVHYTADNIINMKEHVERLLEM